MIFQILTISFAALVVVLSVALHNESRLGRMRAEMIDKQRQVIREQRVAITKGNEIIDLQNDLLVELGLGGKS